MSRLVLIDFSSIARPIYEASGQSTNIDQVSIDIVARIRALASADPHVAICCDSGRSFRKDISADYKAQRPETPAPYLHQCGVALDRLREDGFQVFVADGFEADDIMATLAKRALRPDWQILVVTSDKDMHQLVNESVSVYRPSNGKNPAVTYDAEHFAEQHAGLNPTQIVDYLALVGDSSDNVKGADGIGPKKAAALLAEFGNLDDLYAAMNNGKEFTPALQKALIEFYPRMAEVRSLLTLRTDVPIPFEEIFQPRVPKDAAIPEDDDLMADINEAMPTLAGVVEMEDTAARTEAADGSSKTGSTGETSPVLTAQVPIIAGPNPAAGTTSLVVRNAEPVDWQRELEPRSMSDAKELATSMFASRLFSAYGHPAGIMATVLAGREIGMQAMTALRAFHIIDGKPTLSAGAIHAMILASGKAEYFRCSERTDKHATFVTKRKGDPEMALTFTIEEGRRAFSGDDKKWASSGWGKNPADMCVARAGVKLARLVYPDVVHGLYAPEEME